MSHKAACALLALSCVAATARAEEKRCFDFSRKVAAALHEAPPKAGGDATESGTRDGISWAAIRGPVAKPIEKVLALLLDRETTRDPSVAEMKVELVQTPLYLAHHKVRNLLKPFLFIEVRWVEDWAYALVDGTKEAPQTVVISYEKTEGSSFIQHHCGSIVLRRTAEGTELSQYEESKITGQSVKERIEGLTGLLAKLRRP